MHPQADGQGGRDSGAGVETQATLEVKMKLFAPRPDAPAATTAVSLQENEAAVGGASVATRGAVMG